MLNSRSGIGGGGLLKEKNDLSGTEPGTAPGRSKPLSPVSNRPPSTGTFGKDRKRALRQGRPGPVFGDGNVSFLKILER
jgi:hypothetical protein